MTMYDALIIQSPKYGDFLVLVDPEDHDRAFDRIETTIPGGRSGPWSVSRAVISSPDRPLFYVDRHVKKPDGKWVTERLHRFILGVTDSAVFVNHLNHSPLDNRRINLELTTAKESIEDRKLQSNNTSGCQGVSWNKKKSQWHAYVRHNGHLQNLGFFILKADACRVAFLGRERFHTHGNRHPLCEHTSKYMSESCA